MNKNPDVERVRNAALEILKIRNEHELAMKTRISELEMKLDTAQTRLREVTEENASLRRGSYGLNALVNARGCMLSMKRIAERDGTDTNWPNWVKALNKHIKEIEDALYAADTPPKRQD